MNSLYHWEVGGDDTMLKKSKVKMYLERKRKSYEAGVIKCQCNTGCGNTMYKDDCVKLKLPNGKYRKLHYDCYERIQRNKGFI